METPNKPALMNREEIETLQRDLLGGKTVGTETVQDALDTALAAHDIYDKAIEDAAQSMRNEVREYFLNMIADATVWEVDVDGDVDGVTVTYRLEVTGFSFEQLLEALGIAPKYLETWEDAINREVSVPPQNAVTPARQRKGTSNG